MSIPSNDSSQLSAGSLQVGVPSWLVIFGTILLVGFAYVSGAFLNQRQLIQPPLPSTPYVPQPYVPQPVPQLKPYVVACPWCSRYITIDPNRTGQTTGQTTGKSIGDTPEPGGHVISK